MDNDELLTLLQEVAAEIVTPRFRSLAAHEVMEKNPGDLVTIADRESEIAIAARLRQEYPDALIVGEEAVSADPSILKRTAGADHWFTVDPIDGTKNFVNGSPDHALMVAEMRGHEVVRGLIWQPEYQTAYLAERGAGAYRNGAKLESIVRQQDSLSGHTSRRSLLNEQIGDLPPLQLSWVCCGVDYPHIAQGDADFLLYGGSMPWDHAPGSLLLRETGGVVGYADGSDYDPTSLQTPLLAAGDRDTFEHVRRALASDSATTA
ncbi:inositol monophosphatase family protein [Yimella sp. cx-51]|uniref:inositol monophosphatase family protein n=1 Tax=Yimella sp. cx-51 TaxID=2770551 RepID=UPI00165EA48F|nr:inositol monophosphatase family protein [Yimella sp. cx-51]MBC9956317.1 inositol monophosphatase [Yimella sp. cx-51]QTH38550.1 inositol monophosphatase [Yimella sp. cx-51]